MIKQSCIYIPDISITIYTSLCSSNLRGYNAPKYISNEGVLTDICPIYYATSANWAFDYISLSQQVVLA